MNPQVPTLPEATSTYANLKSAVLGAQQAGGASPLGNFPELQALQNDTAPLAAKTQAVAGAGYNAQVEAANQKAAEATARANANAMLDPSKYQRIPAGDGGWNFVAPNGQSISANDYSRITGQSLDKSLADSQNPIDIGFTHDYKNLQEFLKAIVNKDDTTVLSITKANPELEKYQSDLPGLIKAFQDHYPTVFGGVQNGNQAVSSTFVPTSNALTDPNAPTP